MKHFGVLLVILGLVLSSAGCGVKVFISDRRLRGPVPSPTPVTGQGANVPVPQPTDTPSSEEQDLMRDIIKDLTKRVGEDLVARDGFSGRETPRAGPLRGARVRPGEFIRISAGRSQEVAVEAGEYCVDDDTRCSRVWVHGRIAGGSLGAWYPIVIFDYDLGSP